MWCPIKVNSNTIELLTVHTSCYWILDILCVISIFGSQWNTIGSSVLKSSLIKSRITFGYMFAPIEVYFLLPLRN